MIRCIETLNYRCLRYVSQPLDTFHVLVGPNGSGKTTFLDVVSFLGRFVSDGLEAAIAERTANFQDLVWQRQGTPFEIAIEADIPQRLQERLPKTEWNIIRYELRLGPDENTGEVSILDESVLLKNRRKRRYEQRSLFPMDVESPSTVMSVKGKKGTRRIVSKTSGGDDHFYSEVLGASGKGWFPVIRLGPRKSAFGNLPEDQTRFPVSTWLKSMLSEGVQSFMLNSLLIRRASPPGQKKGFKPDGSNLPWVIADLEKHGERFQSWLAHLRTALPDIETIRTVEREDDRHRYLVVTYKGGLNVPSWMVSVSDRARDSRSL